MADAESDSETVAFNEMAKRARALVYQAYRDSGGQGHPLQESTIVNQMRDKLPSRIARLCLEIRDEAKREAREEGSDYEKAGKALAELVEQLSDLWKALTS